MNVTIRNHWLTLVLVALVVTSTTYAGSDCGGLSGNWTCYDRIQLQSEVASGDSFVVNDSTGTEKFAIDNAGALAVGGATTYTADVTLSGDGIDLLFNAANQNTIGAATKGAKVIYTRAVTGETSTALTISAASGITLSNDVGASGNITLANTKDLLFATDGGSDVGALASCAGTVFADNVQGATGVAFVASEGITLATGEDIVGAVDGTSDVGSGSVAIGTVYADSI